MFKLFFFKMKKVLNTMELSKMDAYILLIKMVGYEQIEYDHVIIDDV